MKTKTFPLLEEFKYDEREIIQIIHAPNVVEAVNAQKLFIATEFAFRNVNVPPGMQPIKEVFTKVAKIKKSIYNQILNN